MTFDEGDREGGDGNRRCGWVSSDKRDDDVDEGGEGPRYPWGPGDSHLETRREPPLGPGRDAERCRTMGGDVTS
ncbi:unnamed protein product [Lampetra fluviatilis]